MFDFMTEALKYVSKFVLSRIAYNTEWMANISSVEIFFSFLKIYYFEFLTQTEATFWNIFLILGTEGWLLQQ